MASRPRGRISTGRWSSDELEAEAAAAEATEGGGEGDVEGGEGED